MNLIICLVAVIVCAVAEFDYSAYDDLLNAASEEDDADEDRLVGE
jgi:hypothetical protein